ncbi:hypothetical protein F5Y05DRAFT_257365 [Hypoxylon sp. FL0543]|nr:hypothetical protein F5Y05DRAFT_257365 [Hypoxylon sp. FL0543]
MAIPIPFSRRISVRSMYSQMSGLYDPYGDDPYGDSPSSRRIAPHYKGPRSESTNILDPTGEETQLGAGANGGASTDQGQDDDPLICTQCRKSFKNKQTLARHAKQVHIGTRCHWPGCAHVAESLSALNDHLKEHNRAASTESDLQCNWPGCGRVYSLLEDVARHLRQHNIAARDTATTS